MCSSIYGHGGMEKTDSLRSLKVHFLLTGPIQMRDIVEDAEHAFDVLYYSKLRLSPDIKIYFLYEHYMDGLTLAV